MFNGWATRITAAICCYSSMSWSCDDQTEWMGARFLQVTYEQGEGPLLTVQFAYPKMLESTEFEYILLSRETDGVPQMAVMLEREQDAEMYLSRAHLAATELELSDYRISLQYFGVGEACGLTYTELLKYNKNQ